MTKTKKQKRQEIPIIEQRIEALTQDAKRVESPYSKSVIQREIEKQQELLVQYRIDIERPNNR